MARAGKQSGYTHTRRCGARAASAGLGGRTRGVPLTPSSRDAPHVSVPGVI